MLSGLLAWCSTPSSLLGIMGWENANGQLSNFYKEFTVYTITLFGVLRWCQNWKMHGEMDSCPGSWSTIKQIEFATNSDSLDRRLVTACDSPL